MVTGKDAYDAIKDNGMLYELFPDCTGVWEHDKAIFRRELASLGIQPSEHLQ